MIKELNGKRAPVILRGHIKIVESYDDTELDIGDYKRSIVLKLPKSTLDAIYADIRGLRKIVKHSDDDTEDKSWFFV